ncbi:MAG: pilus assembly protein TadG-related protein [Nitrospirae bacterium]|nr:pilus assembly protein TadG-related protein [Nitrospirota bacterium]
MMGFKIMYRKGKLQENRGAVAIVTGLALFALVGITALSVDIGYGMITRTELQNVADGAALAGTRQLGMIYEGLAPGVQQPSWILPGADQAVIVNRVQTIALQNQAGGIPISITGGDVQIGTWDFTTKVFTPTANNPTAVSVIARRDGSANGPIVTFVAGIFGINTLNVTATATAALGGLGTTLEGEIEVPIGISKYWFEQMGDYCDQDIMFHPTGDLDGCAGWHTFEITPPNAHNLDVQVVQPMIDGTFESAPTYVGSSQYNYVGGDIASIFDEFEALYDLKKMEEAPYDEWPITLVVYDWNDCSNPNTSITIAGYAKAVIYEVIGPPDKIVRARVVCDYIEGGRSSGTNFGVLGSIPGLVQ